MIIKRADLIEVVYELLTTDAFPKNTFIPNVPALERTYTYMASDIVEELSNGNRVDRDKILKTKEKWLRKYENQQIK